MLADSTNSGNGRPHRQGRHRAHDRRGAVVILMAVLIIVLIGFASLAVDYGRVQIVRSELQGIADAAARAGASDLGISSSAARAAARSVAAANSANGASITLTDAHIEIGRWENNTLNTASASPNAVRVTAGCTEANNNPVPLIFASVIGFQSVNVTHRATAVVVSGIDVNASISAQANPWLAGMPNGTIANPGNPHNKPDKAPYQSPLLVSGIPLTAGSMLTFGSISGTANHDPNLASYNPDGNLNSIWQNFKGAEHGKSDLRAPINSVIGVFLDESSPTSSAAPSMLDFSSPSSREFTMLSPQLKQVFFIGNGMTADEVVQQFVVPVGATRLYLGMMDGYEWNNNSGSRTFRVTREPVITLVE